MKINTKPEKIEDILTRGVDEIINRGHLEKRMQSGKQLRVKFGIDPTAPDLHLGHSIPLRKLRQFQDLGHKVIFLIGDFTAMIGDPTGRASLRKPLTHKQIRENMKNYVQQASKILDVKTIEIRYNSEWYEKKKTDFLLELTSKFTYARVIERDEFKRRIKEDVEISMLELLYPLLQGYDSVELKADVEIGGRDQKFNLLMGRKVQKKYDCPQQDIITVPLLEGVDWALKMSKSYKNYIGLNEEPSKVYGKIMSIPDILLWKYFILLTNIPLAEIENMKEGVYKNIINPRDLKKRLAKELTLMYNGKKAAEVAEREFEKVFKEKKLPSGIPECKIKDKTLPILDLLVKTKLVSSKSEAKRLILQKGVKIDGVVQENWKEVVGIKKGTIIQVGKRRCVKLF